MNKLLSWMLTIMLLLAPAACLADATPPVMAQLMLADKLHFLVERGLLTEGSIRRNRLQHRA